MSPGSKVDVAVPRSKIGAISSDRSNCISRAFFLYNVPLIMRGWSSAVDEMSAPELPARQKMENVGDVGEKAWLEAVARDGADASLLLVLRAIVKQTFLRGSFLAVLSGVLNSFVRPYILRECILILSAPFEDNLIESVVLWAALLIVSMLEGWAQTAALCMCRDECFTKFISITSRLIVAKSLKIQDHSANQQAGSLLGNDVLRTYENAMGFGLLPLGVGALLTGVIMLYWVVGRAAIGGILFMLTMVMITQHIAGITARYQKKALEAAAKRIEILEQIVESSKAVKFFSWEEPYLKILSKARSDELIHVKKFRWLMMLSIQTSRVLPIASAAFTVACMVVLDMELKAADIFSTIAVFMSLRLAVIIIPQGSSSVKQVFVSVRRIQRYLSLPERAPRDVIPDTSRLAVDMVDARLAWPMTGDAIEGAVVEECPAVLTGSLQIPQGKLVAVVGPVGSGKSTLLAAIVGELSPCVGSVRTAKALAYAPQQPQVLCGTVLENVLLGRALDSKALWDAIEATQMSHDLKLWGDGLETEIGERGVSLSGGQKQRISLARTLYGLPKDALLVLDDPIAAVDPLVGRRIMDQVVLAHRRRGGSAIVALNQQAFLHHFDTVIGIENGRIVEQPPAPTPDHEDRSQQMTLDDILPELDEDKCSMRKTAILSDPSSAKYNEGRRMSGVILQEVKQQGRMRSKVAITFFRSMGAHYVGPFLLLACAGYISMASADVWLARWTSKVGLSKEEHLENLAIYVAWVFGFALMILSSSRVGVLSTTRASMSVHQECVNRMLHAPLSWWDGTPKGRITSRFSTDLGLVDTQLGFMLDNTAQLILNVLVLCAIVIYVVPLMSSMIVVCFVLFAICFEGVDRANRELKRMAHQAQSPMLSNLGESVQMQSVARILGTQSFFLRRNDCNIDGYNRMNFSSCMLMHFIKMLAIWVAAGTAAGSSAYVLFARVGDESKGALALTYSVTIPYFLGMCCHVIAVIKSLFTAVERLDEYRSLEQEPAWHCKSDPVDTAWPSAGALEFRDVELRYQPDLPLALKGISFKIPGGQRVGIIGRTGSGKSSLVACIFRLHEIQRGQVLLDDLDISTLGLRCLRQRLTVVPQDPVLMQGTIQKNLDPFNTTERKLLERAVMCAELAGSSEEVDAVLSRNLEGGGANLSCGERQLLCLARAVISGPRVLIMDEPTSSADPATDAKLQSMVRTEFTCTTLCIAHRIQTVADSDLMLVMRDGDVLEFGPPADLYANSAGEFRSMCNLSGVQLGDPPIPEGAGGGAGSSPYEEESI